LRRLKRLLSVELPDAERDRAEALLAQVENDMDAPPLGEDRPVVTRPTLLTTAGESAMARQFSDQQAMLGAPEVHGQPSALPSQQPELQSGLAMSMVVAAVVAGGGMGAFAMLAAQAAEPTVLSSRGVLQALVGVKALILIAALSLVVFRLRAAVRARPLAGYCVGLALSAAGLAWLWGLSGLLLGSGLFYGGLVLVYLTAGRDPDLARAFGDAREQL
jgi:hypothetical protein